MRRTVLWDLHRELGAKMVEFAGYDMPLQYSSIIREHNTVRENAGIFDVSHMARFKVYGETSEEFLNLILVNDVKRLRTGKALYSPICNSHGGIIDDCVVYKLSDTEFMLVNNAVNHQKVWNWLQEHKLSGIKLEDVTESIAQIALQGPKSSEYLERFIVTNLDDVYFYEFLIYEGLIVSRTGYTGEDGFEIYGPPERIRELFQGLIESGVMPAGLGARDTLRLEAGLPLYGNELNEDIDPYSAGLGWTVKLRKGEFIGRESLLRLKSEPKRKLIGLISEGRLIARKKYKVLSLQGEEVGEVTSGTLSPTLDRPIAMAYVKVEVSEEQKFLLQIRARKAEYNRTELPFVKHKFRRRRKIS